MRGFLTGKAATRANHVSLSVAREDLKATVARIGSSGVLKGNRVVWSVSMAKTKKAKDFRKLEDPEKYLVAGPGGATHQTAETAHGFLTTNQGVVVADNQNTLKSGARGPSLLEDFAFREKITHFDHERIPERIVHARGSGAHGYFEVTNPIPHLTRASFLADKGKKTEVFARFSTVAGGAGAGDMPRDVRGFAVKFYTDEGNFDLVGNNIPVFFIQDAIKFPDLIHSVKMEPDRGYPQDATAHDTFWDFISLLPESMNMVLWIMSDRTIPRSLRMMEGFGIHTFRLANADGKSTFVKFHWRPTIGSASVIWDEAVKINGADPDFHRRDLYEAIAKGAFPEWEFGVQAFDNKQAESFDFDVLDPTKIIPEEIIPVEVVGRMVLDRNPVNFFAETEQAAFHPGHLVPGIDFTNDPLLQGRCFLTLTRRSAGWAGPIFTSCRSTVRAVRCEICSATACVEWMWSRDELRTSPIASIRPVRAKIRNAAFAPSLRRRARAKQDRSCASGPRALPITTVRPDSSTAPCQPPSSGTYGARSPSSFRRLKPLSSGAACLVISRWSRKR